MHIKPRVRYWSWNDGSAVYYHFLASNKILRVWPNDADCWDYAEEVPFVGY